VARKNANISLTSYDDIFSTEESRTDKKLEKVKNIPLNELHPFKNHPFRVVDDESMLRTVESVAQYGVLAPAIARPREEGGYELVSGHRRHHASELAGLETMPVIVRNLNDDEAVILMVDSNLQRETILPSERAFAYKMKMDAVRRTAGRPSKNNPRQLVGNLESADMVGEASGDSGRQVQRYIRLTELIPELLTMVDEKKISFNPAVELSFLKPEEQRDFLEAMDMEQNVPSLSQAQRIKKLSQDGNCTIDTMQEIMAEVKKSELDKVTLKNDVLKKYFPKSYTPKQMQDTIIKLLEAWQKKRQHQMER
jgi:ParB family chromosome partitioning protein